MEHNTENVLQHVKVKTKHSEWEHNTVNVLQHVKVETQHCERSTIQ